jgi:hypothetical protein
MDVLEAAEKAWDLVPDPVARPLEEAATGVLAAALAGSLWARDLVVGTADQVVRQVGPAAVRAVLDEMDLTALVRERVDLDAVASDLNVDDVVARVDVDAIVERVDLDAVVERLDLDAVVSRVDIDAVVDRLDLDAIVERVDVGQVVARVDLDAVAARLDIDAVVNRLDLVALANEVVEGIDLPGIIRESSGSMASEVVRGVRLQGVEADEAIARTLGRFLPGRRPRVRPEGAT